MRMTAVYVAGVTMRGMSDMCVAGVTVTRVAMTRVPGVRKAHDSHGCKPGCARREREDVKVHG